MSDNYFEHKSDRGKRIWSLWLGVGEGMKQVHRTLVHGAQKYEAHSWMTVPDAKRRYGEAFLRHAIEGCWLQGLDSIDECPPECPPDCDRSGKKCGSGCLHMACAVISALFYMSLKEK